MQRRMLFRRRNYRFTVGVKITISWADVGTSARFFPLTDEFVPVMRGWYFLRAR